MQFRLVFAVFEIFERFRNKVSIPTVFGCVVSVWRDLLALSWSSIPVSGCD